MGRPIAGKVWKSCPVGMRTNPAWRQLVDRYLASRVSPLSGWPDSYSYWAYRGLVELKNAISAEEHRQIDEAKANKGGPPKSDKRSKVV